MHSTGALGTKPVKGTNTEEGGDAIYEGNDGGMASRYRDDLHLPSAKTTAHTP